MQILDTIQLINAEYCMVMHVEGHLNTQKNIQYDDFPWPNKINYQSVIIAMDQLKAHLPASVIGFSMYDVTIMHHIPAQIRYRWTKEPMIKYMGQ